MFPLAIFSDLVVLSNLIVPVYAVATAHNIKADMLLFRMGITGYRIVLVFDVIIALALYVILIPVNKRLSPLAAIFRLLHTGIMGTSLFALILMLSNEYGYGKRITYVFFIPHIFVLGFLVPISGFRTKTCDRVIAGELARRYGGNISSHSILRSSSIKQNPELKKRWPTGFMGFFWRMMTIFFAKPPAVAGEPIADLMLSHRDRRAINGALFKRDKRNKPDKAVNDEVLGKRLWMSWNC